ncbi:MAG: 2,3-bisphosphoglycerate-dependent phosphoglycerate mutase [bacterium]|nr:2,3-bisphosphoglycerate-dependent phosphoglycerate mutase [bacterium]
MDNILVLVRHGESEWNKKNLFTGWTDVPLTDQGMSEAIDAGERMHKLGYKFDIAFTSHLIRAWKTLILILDELKQEGLPTINHKALNERDYGDLAGLNKDDARKKWGDDQVHVWRRSYKTKPPGGESLKNTAERALPYFEKEIMPQVMNGKNVIVAAHGNSLRAVIMKLDGLTEEEVTQLNLPTGQPIVYRFNEDGSVASKEDGI